MKEVLLIYEGQIVFFFYSFLVFSKRRTAKVIVVQFLENTSKE